MSTVLEIIDNARFDCSTDEDNCPNTRAIVFFNRAKKKCEEDLQAYCVNNLGLELDLPLNLVAGQGVYSFPGGSSTAHEVSGTPQLRFLLDMSVMLDGEQMRKIRPTSYISHNNTTEYLRENQSVDDPKIALHGITGFEIFPTPKLNVTDGIRISYTSSSVKNVIGDAEDAIPIPHQYHDVIEFGVQYRIHKFRRKLDEANLAKEEFMRERMEMVQKFSDTFLGFTERRAIYPHNLMQ